jgi:hypothetical protein
MNTGLLKHSFRITAFRKLNKMLTVSASSFNTGRYVFEQCLTDWHAVKFQVSYKSYQIYSAFVAARTAHHWLQQHKKRNLDVPRYKKQEV